jgi:hypothetical protein
MTEWHRLGSKLELLARVPFSTRIERHRIAVFLYDGRLTATRPIRSSSRYVRCGSVSARAVLEKPMERAGRKANPLDATEEAIV